MIGTSNITQKGQITIPVSIRRDFGIKTGQKLVVTKESNYIKITTEPDFFALKGSIKPKNADKKQMKANFAKYLGTRKHDPHS